MRPQQSVARSPKTRKYLMENMHMPVVAFRVVCIFNELETMVQKSRIVENILNQFGSNF